MPSHGNGAVSTISYFVEPLTTVPLSESFDDAARVRIERPWRNARGVAVPTLLLSASVLGAAATTTWAAVRELIPLYVAVPLHALWGYLAFTPAHEAGHGNVAGNNARFRWLDSVVGWAMTTVLAFPYPMLRYLHLRHHVHTNDPEKDPDHRASGSTVVAILLGCWTVQLGYVRVLWRLLKEGSPGARQAARGTWGCVSGSTAFFALGVYFGFWQHVLLLWILPGAVAQGFLALVFDWLPHHPHANRERYRDTRVLLGPGLEVLLLGQNYHLIHHLYPRVPFYRYSRCFAAVRPLLRAKGSPIEDASRR